MPALLASSTLVGAIVISHPFSLTTSLCLVLQQQNKLLPPVCPRSIYPFAVDTRRLPLKRASSDATAHGPAEPSESALPYSPLPVHSRAAKPGPRLSKP